MVKRGKINCIMALLCLCLLYAGASFAASIEIDLKRAGPGVNGKGIVEIEPTPFVPSDRLLSVDVYHMKENAIYSVWIIESRSGKRVPAGIPGRNFFRTDKSGYAHYTDHTTEFILGWNRLEVAFHPDGDPTNTKEMVVVLWARLYQ